MYFTEDTGEGGFPGIFAHDGKTWYTVLEADGSEYEADESTGVDFSPDGTSMIFCVQDIGYMFQVKRIDGLPFPGRGVLKWKYDLGRR